ncbi:MAG: deoxyribose-phosphate aldolase [Syntrophomonas sp.]
MLAAYLDSTNLKAEAGKNDIRILCEQAVSYEMAAVCINPYRLSLARKILSGSAVKLCTVIGFPLGADSTKIQAARGALENGAHELDMVMNIGAFKDKDYKEVETEIKQILRLKDEYQFVLKVIVETALLSLSELAAAAKLVSQSGADFIKTSTGFSSRGVSMEDIQIITAHKNSGLKIKASGGVRTLEMALQLINAGVDRIGSSNAVQLVEEYRQRGGLGGR